MQRTPTMPTDAATDRIVRADPTDPIAALAAAAAGGRVVVYVGDVELRALAGLIAIEDPLESGPLSRPSADEPLVADPTQRAQGCGVLAGLTLIADDFRPVRSTHPGAEVLARCLEQPVIVELPHGDGSLVLVGSRALPTDRWIAGADNAALIVSLEGADRDRRRAAVAAARATVRGAVAPHARPVAVHLDGSDDVAELLARVPGGRFTGSPAFLRAAGHATRVLPAKVHDALVDFADEPPAAGAMLVRGLPTGEVPATPATPTTPTSKDAVSEFVLLTAARRLGQPVGYLPEHGGEVVQNLVPTREGADRQVSTSSSVTLAFHTETAFHPHAPRYLVLFCLKGDADAHTTLCSVGEVLGALSLGARRVLSEPRFRTGIDESFAGRRSAVLGRPRPILSGDPDRPRLVWDQDLMVGCDTEAESALEELRQVVEERHISVTLEAGDLLVVDNHLAVHGRSPYRPRFDGTDRWLQRTFVVADLSPSAGQRDGRVITTRFAS